MFFTVAVYYLGMKVAFFYSLVRLQVKFDTLRDHWLFLGILYTAGVAFLSYVFLFSWEESFPWPAWQVQVARNFGMSPWQAWMAETLVLYTLYFRLMAKFDEGVIFWTLLLLGIPLVWYI
jgi:hypothetical protein